MADLGTSRRSHVRGAGGRRCIFYLVTLGWAGCVADTPEVAAWFGDNIAFLRDSFGVDRKEPADLATYVEEHPELPRESCGRMSG